MNLTAPGGLSDLGALVLGSAFLLVIILAIVALRRAIRANEATWYLLILFLPILGSLITLAALDKSGKPRNPN